MTRYASGPRVLVFVALTFLLIIPSCSEVTPQKESVTIAQFGDFFLYAPLYVAIDAGYMEDSGLDASLVNTGGDDKTWAAVVSGDAQFGVADPTFVAIAGQRGRPGRIVASIVEGVPFWGVAITDSIPSIDEPEELDGYTVATYPEPSTAWALQRRMFVQANLEPRIRQGSPGGLLAMLRAGAADIALELEPNVTAATTDGSEAKVVYHLGEFYREFSITGLTTSVEIAEERPELVRKVTCAIQSALNLIHTKPDSAVALLLNRFPSLDQNVAAKALDRAIGSEVVPRSVVVDSTGWANAIELRVSVGNLQPLANLYAYIDNRFAASASSQCSDPTLRATSVGN